MKGQRKLDLLRRRLASADEGERLYAVEDLAEDGVPESAPYLAVTLEKETSQVVRDALLFALKRLDCCSAYPSIFNFFRSEDAFLRNAAVSIFGAGRNDAAAYLASRLNEADREVRKLILDALMETGVPDVHLAIREGLRDAAPNVRITAVEYLGRLRDAGSVGEMLALFRIDPEPMLGISIIEALSSIGDISAIKEAISLLMPEGRVNDLNAIYLPQLMKLIGMAGNEEDLVRVLGSVPDVELYAEDIIAMLGAAKKRLGRTIPGREAEGALREIVAAPSLRDDLQYGALALLAHCSTANARKTIQDIMDKADDEDLRSFCRECLDARPGAGGNPNVELTVDEFGTLSELIYRRIGIRLEPKKIYFLSKRVESRLDFTGISTPAEYIRYMRVSDGAGTEFQNLVNLLTINETYFFRDFPQLQAFAEHCLADVVERKLAARDLTLRIWSAGCSTGEEPYTISIILREMLEDISAWDIVNLASDIDNTALRKARAGTYEARSLRDVPQEYLSKYFKKNSDETFALSQKIKASVRFEHLNLADKPALRERKGFDFIFCRNVLIYFDDVSRKQLVDHFYVALNKGGYVFLGSSESVGRITTAFTLARAGGFLIYRKE